MSNHGFGPSAGTEATCEGCGEAFIRKSRGQAWCTPRCYRLTGRWAPTTIHWGMPRNDPDRVTEQRVR